MKSYSLYIGGEDVEGAGWTYAIRASALLRDARAAFKLKRGLELGRDGVEPNEDVVGRCARSGPEDNERALRAAREASRTYGTFPLKVRSRILRDFNRTLAERTGELIDILVAEGHPRRLAQWEVSGMLRGTDETTVSWYETQLRQTFLAGGNRLDLVRKPDGVVCVNPPQNASGSNGTLGVFALLAGNAVVVKAPRTTPLSVMFVYRDVMAPILDRYSAPPGTLNLISGPTVPILNSWIGSPLVDDILFFGDSTVGLQVGQRCLAEGKKAILELAGNDGFVVWEDADIEAAARALEECFYGSSQICMVPKYAIVHPAVADAFIELVLERVRKLRPGYPEDPAVLLSPVLKVDRFFDFIAEARTGGGEVLCGGGRVDVDGMPAADGLFCEPTVLRIDGLDRAGALSCVKEETFFPLLPIIVPESRPGDRLLREVIDVVNANGYGLRNSFWSGDDQIARRFAEQVTNGGLLKINDSHIGFVSPLSTHGGTGLTGGPYGELNYVGLRTTHLQGISWGDGDPRPLDARVTAAGAAKE
ncbi:aldehyde dehydrogenase [Actinomadura darangshiensis]|uniref:Aldehyde dehydrogenase n=1 Tax=Actinomadura darangshiensis TaxID=705336 RepID=A0A4R5BV99_9ACTN|nr:aldehyde dehydrogenase [Actinomadura darangshiensis]TDD89636.1 aldehyde dehydrogenase [Actinomadura darangshiensis]